MTHAVQTARQVITEVDQTVLERNVTKHVKEILEKKVSDAVERQLHRESSYESQLIDRISSELSDLVVLERERLG